MVLKGTQAPGLRCLAVLSPEVDDVFLHSKRGTVVSKLHLSLALLLLFGHRQMYQEHSLCTLLEHKACTVSSVCCVNSGANYRVPVRHNKQSR